MKKVLITLLILLITFGDNTIKMCYVNRMEISKENLHNYLKLWQKTDIINRV